MTLAREYADRIIDLQRKRDYHGAHEVLKEALTVFPTLSFLLKTEVYLLLRLNRIKEARTKAESRLETLKNDTFFLKTYLGILQQEKAKDDMERLIMSIIARNIGDEAFHLFLVKTATTGIGREKGQEVLRLAIARFPESESLRKLAESGEKGEGGANKFAHYRDKFAGRKTAEAIAEIEAVLIIPEYAEDYELQVYLAELYKKLDRYDQAVEIYTKLLSLQDREFTRKMLGYSYYKMGNFDQAVLYLKDVFLKRPDDPYLSRTICKIYEQKQDFEGLERLVTEVLAARPEAKHLYGILKKARKWQTDSATL